MKRILSTHKLTGNGKVFTVNLKTLFRVIGGTNSNPAITTDLIDTLKVSLERATFTGIADVPRGTSGDFHYTLDAAEKVMTITLANLPSGTNVLTLDAQTGTNDRSVRSMVLIVNDNATGTDAAEAVTFDGQDIILDGNLTTMEERIAELEESELEAVHAYGVLISEGVSSPTVTRVGNMDKHRSLPIQSGMVGGLLEDDGTFTEFEDQRDWTSETRDGSEGQVMVKIPEHWRKITVGSGWYKVMLSDVALSGYDHVGEMFCSAYEAAMDRTNNKLCSVVNTAAQYRGGSNESGWDGTYRSLLGRPVTSVTEAACRSAARRRGAGWEQFNHYVRSALIWLYVVEYANLNSQSAINTALDANGCKQGGLGVGVTNWTSGTPSWSTFNNYNPFVPCGYSDSLGNGTGEVDYEVKDENDTTILTMKVNRYRGIEMPFGHTWKFVDGVIVEAGAETSAGGTGKHKVFIAPDPADWGDQDVNDDSKYDYAADQVRSNGYIKTLDAESTTPLAVGGAETTYYCDYNYQNIPSSGVVLHCLIVGGYANYGGVSGLFYFHSSRSLSYSYAGIGARLCYLG